jgi:hypothetical protein
MLYIYVKVDSWEPRALRLTLSTHGPDDVMIGDRPVARHADCFFHMLLRHGDLVRDDLESIPHIVAAVAAYAPNICLVLDSPISWILVKSAVFKCLMLHCGVGNRDVIVYDALKVANARQMAPWLR